VLNRIKIRFRLSASLADAHSMGGDAADPSLPRGGRFSVFALIERLRDRPEDAVPMT
jgi:hypothetical protein